ncbi:MAG: hypothetical protein OEZ06_14875 [Myxococcales bacterium]|nr:hypothetical protein [Myxococcales bacterium]
MSNDKPASSYDLSEGRRIVERLQRGEANGPEPSNGYVRFRARRPAGAPSVSTPAPAAPAPDFAWPEASRGSAGWSPVLAWCRQVASADAGFVLDAHGLLVVCDGAVDSAQTEAIGSRLIIAFEQADRMREGEAAGVIHVQLEGGWLTGLRIPIEEGRALTVALLASAPLSNPLVERLREVLTKKAAGF